MDDKPRGLVDDQQMLVLEDDLERDFLGFAMRGCGFGWFDGCIKLD